MLAIVRKAQGCSRGRGCQAKAPGRVEKAAEAQDHFVYTVRSSKVPPYDNAQQDRIALLLLLAHDSARLLQVRRLSGENAWRGCIELRKRKDHFIFTVESSGVLRPEQLFTRAIDALVAKCDKLLEHL